MKLVAIITEEQAKTLNGECYCGEIRFNPILDGNENWIISQREVSATDNHDFLWVKDLPLSELVISEEVIE